MSARMASVAPRPAWTGLRFTGQRPTHAPDPAEASCAR
jgi:hypothetical protein